MKKSLSLTRTLDKPTHFWLFLTRYRLSAQLIFYSQQPDSITLNSVFDENNQVSPEIARHLPIL